MDFVGKIAEVPSWVPRVAGIKSSRTFKSQVEAAINALEEPLFTPHMVAQAMGLTPEGYKHARDIIRRLERADILVRIGYGRYITMQRYQDLEKAERAQYAARD